jgi:glucosamine--fructose-6-phosphate aminotransferase (isomerizing)
VPIIADALKRLEYRGYDSTGIASFQKGKIERRRATGKLENLQALLDTDPLVGDIGIGHTRWATHGAPTLENAHPHAAAKVAVVHNGIIENYLQLRHKLEVGGAVFTSQTDTEVIAHLAQSHLDAGLRPSEAARATVAALTGAFGIVMLFEEQPDMLFATRRGSPLAIGKGDGEMFIGSDAIALAPLTQEIIYLEEGDFASISHTEIAIRDATGVFVHRPTKVISMDVSLAQKGAYRHWMRKEIDEQKTVVADTVRHYLSSDFSDIALPEGIDLGCYDRILLVGCGTAYYAGMTAKYWIEKYARIPVDIDVASEFRYREPPIPANTLAIFISQSGETADTLAALRYVSGKAKTILSIVNATESSIARESDIVLPILCGPEIGVASTKAFTCQLAVLALIALAAARSKGTLTDAAFKTHLLALRSTSSRIADIIVNEPNIKHVARKMSDDTDAIFLGRGIMTPIALEGALKLKEISYIHAEGYPSGELKHGPIALIDKNMPVIVLSPNDALIEKSTSNTQEVIARGGKIILVGPAVAARAAGNGIWQHICLQDGPEITMPIVYSVVMQMLSYHVALAKGTDVDQPRNLAKSVSVE